MSVSKLSGLKSQLNRLRRARNGVRLGIALTGAAFWILGALSAWFVLDYGFQLSPLHRGLMMLATVPLLAYGLSKAVSALHGWSASLIDTAISVENRHGIDGDLVAAMQFEQGQAIGSSELQTAVVDYVAELKNEIDVFDGFNSRPARNRVLILCLILLGIGGVCYAAPNHVSIFLQRLTLSGVQYPTKTQIASIHINGQEINLNDPATPVTIGYGGSLSMAIQCAGVIPESCRLQIRDEKGETTEATLEPSSSDSGEFVYTVPRLIQPIQYQVFAGDAKTAELSIEIITLPVLKVELAATPPDYAKDIQLSSGSSSTHLAVLAGSDVTMTVVADRTLEAPSLMLQHGTDQEHLKLSSSGNNPHMWKPGQQHRTLTDIQETVTYELNAVDQHGLQPASPIRGTIRVVPDRIPNVSIQTIHHVVLPTAAPVIRYRATDDFGLASLAFRLEIRRGNSSPRVAEVPFFTNEAGQPPQTSAEGEFALDLAPWQLEVDDQVEVVLVATDHRSGASEMPGESDPLHLEIGDESTVLAAIAEADKQSEQMLSELIQQQLGLGETQ